MNSEFKPADAGILKVLIPDAELDASIAQSGIQPGVHLSVERMRTVVADLIMAVSSAVAMADDAEFENSIKALCALDEHEERVFAGLYLDHLIGEIRAQPFAGALELESVDLRFVQIRERVCGVSVDA